MNTLSDVATIERIQAIESELANLRAEAYVRAGIPLPAQCDRMARLVSLAASTFNMSEATIVGANRAVRFCRARFAVMWVAREAFAFSTPVIGRALGARDHSTIISGLIRAEELRQDDVEFLEITNRLLAIVAPKKREEEAENAASNH